MCERKTFIIRLDPVGGVGGLRAAGGDPQAISPNVNPCCTNYKIIGLSSQTNFPSLLHIVSQIVILQLSLSQKYDKTTAKFTYT